MLGESDDLAAVLSVLDRLSKDLETNRRALESTCQSADSIGGGPTLLVGEGSTETVAELREQVAKERAELTQVLEGLEDANKIVAENAVLFRDEKHSRVTGELKHDLKHLQDRDRFQKSMNEYYEVVNKDLRLRRKLTGLQEILQHALKEPLGNAGYSESFEEEVAAEE